MPTRRTRPALAAFLAALIVLAGCNRHPEGSTAEASAPAASALSTLERVARQPQPAIPPSTSAPVVQDLAPGAARLGTDLIAVDVTRVTYTPHGVEIDAVARQSGRVLGGEVYLNYGDEGVLRDDRGNTYRLRDPEDRLKTHFAGADDRWTLHLVALGFLPRDAKRLTLGLNINSLGTSAALVETSWDVPPTVASKRRVAPADVVRPGAGWTYAAPPTGNSPQGNASIRVFSIDWLKDGIALTFEALNGTRDTRTSLNSANWQLRLVDDRGHIYRVVQNEDSAARAVPIENGQRIAGRLLFAPQIAPDATRLRLLANAGPAGDDPWAAIDTKDDNMFAARVAVDLGTIPDAARSHAPVAAKQDVTLNLAQPPLPSTPLATSTMDPIAKLKQELGAKDSDAGTTVDLPSDVLFDFDKATLRPDAQQTVDTLADLLRRIDRPVTISGHTDAQGRRRLQHEAFERTC
ncbi:OmpA family protein [Lysobacter sp. HA35]